MQCCFHRFRCVFFRSKFVRLCELQVALGKARSATKADFPKHRHWVQLMFAVPRRMEVWLNAVCVKALQKCPVLGSTTGPFYMMCGVELLTRDIS